MKSKILYFIFYMIDHSVYDQFLPSKIKSKDVFDNIFGKMFFK